MAKSKMLVGLVVILSALAEAQYSSQLNGPVSDITSYIRGGTNAWVPLPGNKSCLMGTSALFPSLSVAKDDNVWCVGSADNSVWKYTAKTRTWAKQTAMGTAAKQMVVENDGAIYSLQSLSNCAQWAPDLNLMKWTGSSWAEVLHNACWSVVSVGRDGFMAAITRETQLPQYTNKLWYSTNNGLNWTQWGTSNWSYVSMFTQDSGCGIDSTGAMWELTTTPGASSHNRGKPTGASPLIQCINLPLAGDIYFVLDSAGNVYMDDHSDGNWHKLALSGYRTLQGDSKAEVVVLSASGYPYILNMLAMSVTGTTSGTWNSGCPGPGQQCNANTTHTGNIQVKFHSGHGLNANGGLKSQSVLWNSAMDVASWDTSPLCNPFLGDPDSTECPTDITGSEVCNQSHANIGGGPNPLYSVGFGHWYTKAVYPYPEGVTYGPMIGPDSLGFFHQDVTVVITDNCLAGVPTCRPADENGDYWDLTGTQYGSDPIEVHQLAAWGASMGKWVLFSEYMTAPPFPTACVWYGTRTTYLTDDGICD